MAIETYDLCKLTPSEVSLDVVGSSIDGGRTIAGITQAVDYAGGGFVTCTYGGIQPHTRSQHRYWSKLGAILNGSVRPIIVPLWTDYIGATNALGQNAGLFYTDIPHSDGALFSDGAGYQQGLANPIGKGAFALNATTITMTLKPGTIIEGGEWFSILHTTRNYRAYRIYEIVSQVGNDVTVKIAPPLREAIANGIELNFWRPRCLMRLSAGQTLAWDWSAPGVIASLSVPFVEASWI